MVALRESLSDLRKVAAQLNAASDELNAVIESLEKQLAESKIGLTLWLDDKYVNQELLSEPYEDDEGRTGVIYWGIGYEKLDDQWCIAARQTSRIELPGGDDSIERIWELKPLVNAPRVVRVEAAGQLEMLVYQLTVKAQAYLESIAKAKALTE